MWIKISESSTIGTKGSKGGTIVEDEEYNDLCRITLEKCKGHYAITSGIYGFMVHTAFCGESDYQENYNEMKSELQTFVDSGCKDDTFYERFSGKY